MFNNTLTDLYIERGILEPAPSTYILDGDDSFRYILDEEPQKEEKSRE